MKVGDTMSYKIIRDVTVIDVLDEAVWICLSKKGHPIRCGSLMAAGVLSSDGSAILHIAGAAPLGDYPDVSVVDITPEEAAALRAQLDLGEEVPDEPPIDDAPTDEPPPDQEENDSSENVMTAAEMRRHIVDLTAAVETMVKQNTMLVDCILEMSEVVYGG